MERVVSVNEAHWARRGVSPTPAWHRDVQTHTDPVGGFQAAFRGHGAETVSVCPADSRDRNQQPAH